MAILRPSENPEFSAEMEAMQRTTPAHYDEWNKRHQQLLDNDQYLKNQVDSLGLAVDGEGRLCMIIKED